MMKMMPSCLSRFSKQSMSLTLHTGTTSLTQVVLIIIIGVIIIQYHYLEMLWCDATVLSWVCFHAMRHDAASTIEVQTVKLKWRKWNYCWALFWPFLFTWCLNIVWQHIVDHITSQPRISSITWWRKIRLGDTHVSRLYSIHGRIT